MADDNKKLDENKVSRLNFMTEAEKVLQQDSDALLQYLTGFATDLANLENPQTAENNNDSAKPVARVSSLESLSMGVHHAKKSAPEEDVPQEDQSLAKVHAFPGIKKTPRPSNGG